MESLNLDFLKGASEVGYGPTFRNDRSNLAVVQIEGSFTGLSMTLEGRTDVDTGPWETVAGWSVSTPDTKTETVSSAGIYEWRIEGIREFRFRILSITSGSVNASGVLYNSADNSTYPYASAPGSITFGDPALFVKGICEQIFFDPSTGNIVGYDNTATDGSVTISVNLAEIAGGMGNRLIGVLPDTARISGGYTSSAFSLETREKIMGGQIAYNAVVPVCEKITADSTELVVSKKPAPYYGEDSIPDIRVPVYREIANADIASFTTQEAAPLKSLAVGIEPVQAGSGDPSPDNVRPISGWTGAKVTRCGKNLFPNAGDVTAIPDRRFFYSQPIILKGQTVTLSASSVEFGGEDKASVVMLLNKNNGGVTHISFTVTENGGSWTATEDIYGLDFYSTSSPITSPGVRTIYRNVQLELGSTATDYEPYQGETYDITFPTEAGTVYGGTLDVTRGLLTVDRLYKSLDGTEEWAISYGAVTDKSYFYLVIGASGSVVNDSGICSHFMPVNITSGTADVGQKIVNSVANNARLLIRPENVEGMALNDFTDWLAAQAAAGTPVQITYKLTSPAVYQLTPTEITTLIGENNVWADTGEIQLLQYRSGWDTIEADGNIYRAYVTESGKGKHTGEAYGVDAKTGQILGFAAEARTTYEITYFTHNVSAQMLPIPSIWNPVMMTVQERYGVYAKQNGSAEKGVLKGWLYFIVPRAILNADAGESASETANATTDGSWIAIPEKPENMPFCDCDESAHPAAYYVYVPCSDENDAVTEVVSVGSGLTLKAGKTAQLPIKLVMPDDSLVQPDFTRMGYYSEDEAVATVDNRGIVTAVSEGQTVVHAFVTKSDSSSLDSRTIVAVEGTRKTLTANRNNILVG